MDNRRVSMMWWTGVMKNYKLSYFEVAHPGWNENSAWQFLMTNCMRVTRTVIRYNCPGDGKYYGVILSCAGCLTAMAWRYRLIANGAQAFIVSLSLHYHIHYQILNSCRRVFTTFTEPFIIAWWRGVMPSSSLSVRVDSSSPQWDSDFRMGVISSSGAPSLISFSRETVLLAMMDWKWRG